MAAVICSDFGAPQNKVSHCFHCFPIYPPWSYGTICHDISLLNGRIILLKKNLRKTNLSLPPSSMNQILLRSWIQNEVVHHHPWHYFQQIDNFEINIFVIEVHKIFLWVGMIYLPLLSMDSWVIDLSYFVNMFHVFLFSSNLYCSTFFQRRKIKNDNSLSRTTDMDFPLLYYNPAFQNHEPYYIS